MLEQKSKAKDFIMFNWGSDNEPDQVNFTFLYISNKQVNGT
jgi:hypothetical protein